MDPENKKRIWDYENEIADLIREFRKEEGIRRPAPEKVDQIVSILKDRVGGNQQIRDLFKDLKEKRRESVYYQMSKEIYKQLLKKH